MLEKWEIMKNKLSRVLQVLKKLVKSYWNPLIPHNAKRSIELPDGSKLLLKTKFTIPVLIDKLGFGGGEGVEVGVQKGVFSELLLSVANFKKLYSVDPWKHYDESIYSDDDANVGQDVQDNYYQETADRLKPYGDRSHILRMESLSAARLFRDERLDFVFIDANHSYKSVKEDIEAWWPKVKRGGILSGDDYLFTPKGKTPVKDAVDEFVKEKKLVLYLTCNRFPRWLVIKK